MGPLNGYTVLELAGIGPAPMGAMILADMGAEVIRIDRAAGMGGMHMKDVSSRGKKSVALNLKDPAGVETLLRMVENADVLVDPMRPGVCEKLGIGPDVCLERNPKLVYSRMTGWGQDGPLAQAAGHDINYISITGALYAMGRKGEKPVPPLNLVGDFGGGGMLLVTGVLAALLETGSSGKGQVLMRRWWTALRSSCGCSMAFRRWECGMRKSAVPICLMVAHTSTIPTNAPMVSTSLWALSNLSFTHS